MSDPGIDKLWKEYKAPFVAMDDLTLARWMCQTLGQFEGKLWRLSHPLVSAYRLAADEAKDRQIWFKRLATPPAVYPPGDCCRAPFLPYFTRDILNVGLVCHHCGETAVPFDEIPRDLQAAVKGWADEYEKIHAVAHWEESEQAVVADYEETLEEAAASAERLLKQVAIRILPRFLEFYPALIWEDQDECLEVRPDEIELS